MIAYYLQARSAEVALKSLRWIYSPDNFYLIGLNPIDSGIFDVPLKLIPDNVWVIKSLPVTWGGRTLLDSIMQAMDILARTSNKWSHFINLTDTCFPLKSQNEIQDFLLAQSKAGTTDFISYYGPLIPEFPSASNVGSYYIEGVSPRSDTQFYCDSSLQPWFERLEETPILNPGRRLGIHVEDYCGKVYVRALYPQERRIRLGFFERVQPCYGRPWAILSRRSCEWLLSSESAQTGYLNLCNIFVPDEAFFQTLLFGPASPRAPEQISRTNLWVDHGQPEIMTDADFDRLTNSSELFARKLIPQAAPRLLDWLAKLNPAGDELGPTRDA